MALFLSTIITFFLAFHSAFGLTCYKCDSSESTLCNYGLTSFAYPTAECNSDAGGGVFTNWIPKQCVKIVATGKNGNEYVARGCVPHLGGACQAIVKTLGFFSNVEDGVKDINCYTCDGDKCNSAMKTTGFTFLGLVLAVFLLAF